ALPLDDGDETHLRLDLPSLGIFVLLAEFRVVGGGTGRGRIAAFGVAEETGYVTVPGSRVTAGGGLAFHFGVVDDDHVFIFTSAFGRGLGRRCCPSRRRDGHKGHEDRTKRSRHDASHAYLGGDPSGRGGRGSCPPCVEGASRTRQATGVRRRGGTLKTRIGARRGHRCRAGTTGMRAKLHA